MPVDWNKDPDVIAMSPQAYGMLSRLVFYLWVTKADALPMSANDIYVIARARKSTWASQGPAITAAATRILNFFVHYRQVKANRNAALANMRAKGHVSRGIAKYNAQRAAEMAAPAAFAPLDVAKQGGTTQGRPAPVKTRTAPVGAGFVDKGSRKS